MTQMDKFSENGQEKIIVGLTKIAEIVSSTMGPGGRKVSLPTGISRDGYNVAKHSVRSLADKYESVGAGLLLDAADKTVAIAGDATSTTCCLAASLLANMPKEYNAFEVSRDIKAISGDVMTMIDSYSSDASLDTLRKMAIIAANNNEWLGNMVADLIWELGAESFVKSDHSKTTETTVEIKRGYRMDGGVVLPQFLEGNASIDLHNPLVVLIEEKVEAFEPLLPIYEAFQTSSLMQTGNKAAFTRPLVIVVAEMEGDAIKFVLSNLLTPKSGVPVPVYVVKAPGMGMERFRLMEDLQFGTGTETVISNYSSNKLKNFSKGFKFGECDIINIGLNHTHFSFKDKFIDKIDKRVDQIKKEDDSEFNKERVSKLTKGVGVVHIGGATDSEKNYLIQVIEDVVRASQAAMRDGVCPGAGWVLNKAALSMIGDSVAVDILKSALKAPMEQILSNVGIEVDYVEDKLFNVITGEYEDIDDTDILDSTAAVKSALENAVSLTTQIMETKFAVIK